MNDIIEDNSYEIAKRMGVSHKKILKTIKIIQADFKVWSNINDVEDPSNNFFIENCHITKKSRSILRYDITISGYTLLCNRLGNWNALTEQLRNIHDDNHIAKTKAIQLKLSHIHNAVEHLGYPKPQWGTKTKKDFVQVNTDSISVYYIGESDKNKKAFIRSILTDINGFKHSFEMSGYETEMGECTKYNNELLDRFAFLGIYNYTWFLNLDFHKGLGILNYKSIMGYDGFGGGYPDEFDGFGGLSTTEIIYHILEKTVCTGTSLRRRD